MLHNVNYLCTNLLERPSTPDNKDKPIKELFTKKSLSSGFSLPGFAGKIPGLAPKLPEKLGKDEKVGDKTKEEKNGKDKTEGTYLFLVHKNNFGHKAAQYKTISDWSLFTSRCICRSRQIGSS